MVGLFTDTIAAIAELYACALIGGAALGLLNAFSSYYVGGEFQQTISVGLLMLILLLKPEGLLGSKSIRPV